MRVIWSHHGLDWLQRRHRPAPDRHQLPAARLRGQDGPRATLGPWRPGQRVLFEKANSSQTPRPGAHAGCNRWRADRHCHRSRSYCGFTVEAGQSPAPRRVPALQVKVGAPRTNRPSSDAASPFAARLDECATTRKSCSDDETRTHASHGPGPHWHAEAWHSRGHLEADWCFRRQILRGFFRHAS